MSASNNVITPNSPIGPAVDLCGFGTNQSMTNPLKGVLTTPMLSQQGCLSKNVVDVPKLQNTFKSFNNASLDKPNKSIVVIEPFGSGTNIINSKVGSTERGR